MNRFLGIVLGLCLLTMPVFSEEILPDEIVDTILVNQPCKKPEANLNYNYEDTDKVEIKLAIMDAIKSENDVYENEPVKFRVISDVHYKGRVIIKRHTIVPAKVGLIIRSGMNGIPASIIFSDFEFSDIDPHLITDTVEIRGQDRSLWVFPLKWALTILPPSGSLTNFIKGGHARVKKDRMVKVYYHPNWNKPRENKENYDNN